MAENATIFTRSDSAGEFEPIKEDSFGVEDELQELVADHPELLVGEQITPGDPRRWILVTREMGIPDSPDTGNRWSLDHLLIDQDAVPTLVETKLRSNHEINRGIVGQMMSYAAHATKTWRASEVRRIFESRVPDPEAALAQLLQLEGAPDADAFWADVAVNLEAKRLRLLFVADAIPNELATAIEFLNEQMPNIDVAAIEIKRYKFKGRETIVPRVVRESTWNNTDGRSGRNLTMAQIMDHFEDDRVQDAAKRLLSVARAQGALISPSRTGFSIRTRCPLYGRPLTVAWIYPPSSPGWMATKDFTFGAGNGDGNGGVFGMDDLPQEVEEQLQDWVDEFGEDPFAENVSSTGVRAYSVSPQQAAEHINLLEARLKGVINRLTSLKPS